MKLINIVCPNCKTNLELEGTQQDWAGQTIDCPKCKTKVAIPDAPRQTGILKIKDAAKIISITCPSCSKRTVIDQSQHQELSGKWLNAQNAKTIFIFLLLSRHVPIVE